jgi:hypothetical protein
MPEKFFLLFIIRPFLSNDEQETLGKLERRERERLELYVHTHAEFVLCLGLMIHILLI